MMEPCTQEWWTQRKREIHERSPGYRIATAQGDYVIAGYSYPTNTRNSKLEILATGPSITDKKNDEVVARLNYRKSITFPDGHVFSIKWHNGFPFWKPDRYEFIDSTGRSQFRIERGGITWINPNAQREHVLILLAAERYLIHINRVEAFGAAGG
jgi:hypothetical protein